jgi:hypothetical protein
MRKILLGIFLIVSTISFAQSQTATETKILGVTTIGSFTYIAVESDGRVKINRLPTFSDGSNEVSARVDPDNLIYVNLAKDTRPLATKTTTNTLATNVAQTIPPIVNQRTVTVNVNEESKFAWVKVGAADAGEDSGIKIYGSIIIDNASGSIISYYASPSVKIAIIQE